MHSNAAVVQVANAQPPGWLSCSHSAATAYFIVLQIVKMQPNGLRTRPAQFGTSILYDFKQNLGFQILLWQLIVMCIK